VSTVVPAALAAAIVLLGAWRLRPAPARALVLAPAPPPRRPLDPRLRRWLPAIGATALAAAAMPIAAPVAGLAAWGAPVLRQRRRERQARDRTRAAVPEVVDLFALAVSTGLTVPLATAAVAARHDGPLHDDLAQAVEDVARGRRCADALDDAAARLPPEVRPLLTALVASERYGAPLQEGLARIAADARADHRRRAEEAARRVPVQLLFPLVLCVLPAFGLLTLAPLLAGAFGSLRLGS
jgi:tight adherence protein C